MKTITRKFTLLLCFNLLFAFCLKVNAQTLTSNESSYHPGVTVSLIGLNFTPYETVELRVVHPDSLFNDSASYQPWQVTADDVGKVVATWVTPTSPLEVGVTVQATATGLTSSLSANVSFFVDFLPFYAPVIVPTITTDQSDYAPGSIATFTGVGFEPNESVRLKVKNLTQPCQVTASDSSYTPWFVNADGAGEFVTTWTVCQCGGNSLKVKATGQSSNFVAEAYFLDDQNTYTTSGTFIVPLGVTSIDVECWGAGGGGGGATTALNNAGGSGGGGGRYNFATFAVTGGQSFNVTVGAGGAAGSGNGGTGGTTSVTATIGGIPTLSATGGTGGNANQGTAGTGATGGVWSGGNGAVGTTGAGAGGGGGAGNGGSGATGNITNGSSAAGGIGSGANPLAGGIGGAARTGNGVGNNGTAPGGGGGGGKKGTLTSNSAGGSGGAGLVRIFYTLAGCSGVPSPIGTASASPSTFACSGSSFISLTGYVPDNGITFQWYSSTDNINFNPIGGATNTSYATPTLTQTTYYYCILTCTSSGLSSAPSNTATVTRVAITGGSAASTLSSVSCSNVSFTLSLTGASTAGTTYQWESSPDNASWSPIGGATGATLITTEAASTFYRCIVSCATSAEAVASASKLVSMVNPVGGTTTASVATTFLNPACTTTAVTLSLSGATTGLSFQWQSSADNISFFDIGAATAATYAVPNVASKDYYRCKVYCASSGAFAMSTSIQVFKATCINMPASGTTINSSTCYARFFDNGGSGGTCSDMGGASPGYSNSMTSNYTFTGTVNNQMKVTFNSYCSESSFDFMTIYNGANTSQPVLKAAYAGSSIGGPYQTTGTINSITFRFTSDASVSYAGWDAIVECISLCNPPTALNVPVGSITSVSASPSWTPPAFSPSGGYDWELRTGGTCGSGSPLQSGNTALTEVDLAGLSPNSTYTFCVRTNCGSTQTGYVSTTFTTGAPCTGSPQDVTAGSVAQTTASMSWTYADPASLNNFDWELRTSGACGSGPAGLLQSGTGATSPLPISGLSSLATYSFCVRANCNSGGPSSWGTTTFTTLAPPCSGTPAMPVMTISPSTGCLTASITLTITNPDNSVSGLQYKFQRSTNGGTTWTDLNAYGSGTAITGAFLSGAGSNMFRAVSKCIHSAIETPSLVVSFGGASSCSCNTYCTPSTSNYGCPDGNSSTQEYISRVILVNSSATNLFNNTSTCSSGFQSFTSVAGGNISQGSSYTVKIETGGWFSQDRSNLFIDWNNNGVFTDAGETYNMSVMGSGKHQVSFTVPYTSFGGSTRMRVRLQYNAFPGSCGSIDYGEAEDYCLNVAVAPPCAAVAPGGTSSSLNPVCYGVNFSLSVGNAPLQEGLSYQWQKSADGISGWTDISGATSSTSDVSQISDTYYRCRVTCSHGGATDFSAVYLVATSSAPFVVSENFSSTTFPPVCWTRSALSEAVTIRATTNAFGAAGSGSAKYDLLNNYNQNYDLITPVFAPMPACGGTLTFDEAYAGLNVIFFNFYGNLQIYTSTNGGSSYSLHTTFSGNPTGNPTMNTGGSVLIGAFTPTAAQWANKQLSLPAGVNRVMFRAVPNSSGDNNLYLDNVIIKPVPPIAAINASAASVCVGGSVNFTDASTQCPLSWNWSFPGGAPGSSANQNPGAVTFNTAGAYTVQLTASNNGGSSSATTVINVYDYPVATINGSNPFSVTICQGDDPGLTAAGGTSYLWSTNQPGALLVATPSVNTDYTVTVTANGCSSTASASVIVNVAPVITFCPPDILNTPNDASTCEASVSFPSATATGIPAPGISYTITSVPLGAPYLTGTTITSPFNFYKGTTTVTIAAQNVCNTATCTFNVTIIDVESPVIIQPADITGTNDPGDCGKFLAVTNPASSDNCPGSFFSQRKRSDFPNGQQLTGFYPVGPTTITWSVSDLAISTANVTTTTQLVTINDNENPVFTSVPTIVQDNDVNACGAEVYYGEFELYKAEAIDNCAIDNIVYNPASGYFFPIGTSTVTVTATDNHSNSTTTTFTVTINDVQIPVINNVPANITVYTHGSSVAGVYNGTQICSQPVSWAAVSVSDNCPGAQLFSDHNSGDVFPLGTTTVHYVANDAHSNNAAPRQFDVTVIDNTKPAITCPGNVTQSVNTLTCTATGFVLGNATALDNCTAEAPVGISIGSNASASYAGPTSPATSINHTIIWTATDAAGNSNTCPQTLTITNAKPVMTGLEAYAVGSSTPTDIVFVNQNLQLKGKVHDESGTSHSWLFNDDAGTTYLTTTETETSIGGGLSEYTAWSPQFLYAGNESRVAEPSVVVTDACGASSLPQPGVSTLQFLAVATASGGFTTHGGFYYIPSGAQLPASGQPGYGIQVGNRINTGDVSKYVNGNTCKGQLQHTVHGNNNLMNVHVDNGANTDATMDYLTISNPVPSATCSYLAIFRAPVKIDGQTGNYKILVAQTDGDKNPAYGHRIRVKIGTYSGNSWGTIFYDTQPGAPDGALPTTPLANGKTKVQPTGSCRTDMTVGDILSGVEELLFNVPNPTDGQTDISFNVTQDGKYTLKVYNSLGQEVATLFNEEATAGTVYTVKFDGSMLDAGIYTYAISGENYTKTARLSLIK